MPKLRRYEVVHVRSGHSFIRYGRTSANVVKRLGSSARHREEYVVRRRDR